MNRRLDEENERRMRVEDGKIRDEKMKDEQLRMELKDDEKKILMNENRMYE